MTKIDELIQELCPDGVETFPLEECCNILDKKRKPVTKNSREKGEYPYYGANGVQDYVSDYIFNGKFVLVGEDGSVITKSGTPVVTWAEGKIWVNNHAHILKGKAGFNEDSLYLFLANTNMAPIVTGAAQPKINQANLKNFPITTPDSETMLKFNNIIQPFFDQRLTNESEIKKLEALQSLLLTRLVD